MSGRQQGHCCYFRQVDEDVEAANSREQRLSRKKERFATAALTTGGCLRVTSDDERVLRQLD